MQVTSYSNFRKNLKSFFDNIINNHEPLFISRNKGEDIVVMSKSDFESIQETFYLLKNPANAKRLMEGIAEYEQGLGKERNLIEE